MKPYMWIAGIVGTLFFLPGTIRGKEVMLDRPGTLQQHFSPDEIKNTTVLSLKGPINLNDFQFLWSVPWLSELDLSEAVICETGESPAHTIPTSAFWGKKFLKKVILPPSVTGISNYAFYGCTDLSHIEFPAGLTTIGTGAFSLCDSVKTFDLSGCPVLTRINERAFSECSSLRQAVLPPSLKVIANRLFKDCRRLESVTLPDSATTIENGAFSDCSRLTAIALPPTLEHIGNQAFESCSRLSRILLPEGLKTIGNVAFYRCTSLDSIQVPASVTGMEANAFRSCTSLTGITVSPRNSVYTGKNGVVYKDKGKTLYIYPAGKKGDYVLPADVLRLQQAVFYYCPFLTAILTEAGNPVFSHSDGVLFSKDGKTLVNYPRGKKGTYPLPAEVTQIGSSAFSGSPYLTGIEIPDRSALQLIQNHAFYDCAELARLDLSAATRLTEIGASAFENCGSLQSVTLPADLRLLGNSAFYRCEKLDSIRFMGTVPPECANNVFTGLSPECLITVPDQAGENYRTLPCFKDLYEIREPVMPADPDSLSGHPDPETRSGAE